MADKISLSQSELQNCANTAKRKAADTRSIISSLDKMVNGTLDHGWQGEGIKGFKDRFAKIKTSLESAAKLIDEIETNLIKTKEYYAEADAKVDKAFRN